MKAVILAAGEGSRMRPLTYTRPKVMLPIVNKPILEHLIIEAAAADIRDFIFIVGYHDEQVRDYFGDGDKWQLKIEYITQRKPLGTADAVISVKAIVEGNFLVMNGDIIASRRDIKKLAARNNTTMGIRQVENINGLGVVELEKDSLVNICEKTDNPPSDMANTGLYLLTQDTFEAIAQTPKSVRGEYEITASLQLMLAQGKKINYQRIEYWLDCSYPWDLLTANQALMDRHDIQNLGRIEDNAVLHGDISIGRDTVIRSGCYIIGPVVIGSNCDIGPNCYIRPFSSIGDSCRIGTAVEIKSSIIMKNTKIPHHSYIGDSVIGEGCNFGAGTKIANLRLDKNKVTIAGIDTGRSKMGAIVGDGVQTGVNASINVGSLIGNGAVIGPGAVASGNIMPGATVF